MLVLSFLAPFVLFSVSKAQSPPSLYIPQDWVDLPANLSAEVVGAPDADGRTTYILEDLDAKAADRNQAMPPHAFFGTGTLRQGPDDAVFTLFDPVWDMHVAWSCALTATGAAAPCAQTVSEVLFDDAPRTEEIVFALTRVPAAGATPAADPGPEASAQATLIAPGESQSSSAGSSTKASASDAPAETSAGEADGDSSAAGVTAPLSFAAFFAGQAVLAALL